MNEQQKATDEAKSSVDGVVMACLGCGKEVIVKEDSLEAQGVFNVFYFGGECEDRYSARL